MLSVKINPDLWETYPVSKGERYEFVFGVSQFLPKDQTAQLYAALNDDFVSKGGYLKITGMTLVPVPPPEIGPPIEGPEIPTEVYAPIPTQYELHITATVVKNPIMLGLLIEKIVALAYALLIYLSIKYVYLMGKGAKEAAKEAPKTMAMGFVAILALAILGILFIRKL